MCIWLQRRLQQHFLRYPQSEPERQQWRTDGSTDGQVEEFEIPVQFENAGFGLYPNPASDPVDG